jgi:hypothetical protein
MNSLHQLACRLTGSFSSFTGSKQSHFVNEIPSDMPVNYNCEWVSSVISNLLATIAIHAKDDCIRLSAKQYGYIIVFEIHKPGQFQMELLNPHLRSSQTMAERIGGCVAVNIDPSNSTIISFSFPNLPASA